MKVKNKEKLSKQPEIKKAHYIQNNDLNDACLLIRNKNQEDNGMITLKC